jgi:ATP-dependent helicase/nuclease subunit A
MIDDSLSRRRALDPATSFIVQAPAGSGKTELLIQRYLKLLGRVRRPEAAIAITFTRKAAGEMRARVLDALRKAAEGVQPESPHEEVTAELAREALTRDRELGWRLLENPALLRVQTIDSLCATITRQMPWLARFGAPPEITEKAEPLYREAARNLLERTLEEEERAGRIGDTSRLLLHLDNDFGAAEGLIAQMLEKRDQWLRSTGVGADLADVRRKLEEALEHFVRAGVRRLSEAFPKALLIETIEVGCCAACNLEAEHTFAAFQKFDRLPGDAAEDLSKWRTIADLLLTGEGEWRRAVTARQGFPPKSREKDRCQRLLVQAARENGLLAALQEVQRLPPPCFEETQWRAMEAVVNALPRAVAELQLVFRERGTVDFAELSIRASEALGSEEAPSDLALALGYRIEHLLVDEFQDTSYTQFELLKKLTAGWEPGDGRTLFLVGDPMQSIYRFRQAEVSLFLKARREGIGSIRLEALSLTRNFRSQPAMVEWINSTFTEIFPTREDVENGAVAYTRSESRESMERDAAPEIHAFAGDARQPEAERVAELAADASQGTVGILARARPHLPAILAQLRKNGVLFQAIEVEALGERASIQDLMALTFALLHPADRVAWLAILRAPWCGLAIEDLHRLASGDHATPMWDLLNRPDLKLSVEGGRRLERFRGVLAPALSRRGRRGLRNLVEDTWMQLGGPACAREKAEHEDAAAYFDLLESLEEAGDLGGFDGLRKQVTDLFAHPDSASDGRVQVMTIHKAKGLEFDTVILPGLGQRPRKDDPGLLIWLEQEGHLLLAPMSERGQDEDPIYRFVRRMDQRRAEYETARLLYVAATRARRKLHLLGCIRDADAEPSANSFLELLWPVVRQRFLAGMEAAVETAQPAMARRTRRLTADWEMPAPPAPVEWTRDDSEPIEAAPEVTFEWAGDTLRHVGTVLHAFLQRIAREGCAGWDRAAIARQRGAYRAMLAGLGVTPDELEQACDDVTRGLNQTLRDTRGRWALGPHAEAECEAQVTGMIDGKLYRAAIDRTFVDEDGVRWIIDYKTGAHAGGNQELFLDEEQRRYGPQLERYGRLMAQRESRPIRLGLYFPLLDGWREWALERGRYRQATLFGE